MSGLVVAAAVLAGCSGGGSDAADRPATTAGTDAGEQRADPDASDAPPPTPGDEPGSTVHDSTAPDSTAPDSTAPDRTAPGATTAGSAAPDDTVAEVLVGPDGDAFYTPPSPLPGDQPGDLIWARPLEDSPAASLGWQVLYRSESLTGDPIAVSGIVIAPATPPVPSDPNVVLSWAHGTTGMGDQCAPSRTLDSGFSAESLLAGIAVGRGWTFVATDYEGLGTPGVHPYLVGPSEGRGVLDIVRAASQIPEANVTEASPVALFGHSQGGHAALMAAEIASSYAPELDIAGTVAGAPPGELGLIAAATAARGSGAGGFGLMMRAGFLAAHPDLPVDAAVAPEDVDLLDDVADVCTEEAFALAGELEGNPPDPSTDPAWRAALEASSPGRVAPSGPVLIVQGDEDTTVPPALSKAIRDRYCSLDVTVQRTVYRGQDHVGVIVAAIGEIQGWIQDRLEGVAASDDCAADQPV